MSKLSCPTAFDVDRFLRKTDSRFTFHAYTERSELAVSVLKIAQHSSRIDNVLIASFEDRRALECAYVTRDGSTVHAKIGTVERFVGALLEEWRFCVSVASKQ